ncbi:hypothetical protein [Mesorhizobium sp.]|uniref:hypothetical protein n=1 Tax=Mesorhizobium sp. TaxID=1871066 RepID=UPI000FE7F0F6|nr:hypothetical protein [Mesorhizobium sp.]RWA78317.1 MAG: hypothetical protein EOQ30_30355 [Mesorhizobium sp.]
MNIDDSAGMPSDGGGAALEGGIGRDHVRTLAISIATSTAAASVGARLQRKAALAAVSAVAFLHSVGPRLLHQVIHEQRRQKRASNGNLKC